MSLALVILALCFHAVGQGWLAGSQAKQSYSPLAGRPLATTVWIGPPTEPVDIATLRDAVAQGRESETFFISF